MHGLGLSLWTGEDVPEMTTTASNDTDELVELNIGDDNWDKVLAYVQANKKLGAQKIGQQLKRKYKVSESAKKEIISIINK
jgi:hypothetical protein